MKLQLLLLACLFALSSALVARRPSQLASGLSSSRINNYGLTARDDDFDICFRGVCYECDRDERCRTDRDCYDDDDDDDDDDDTEYCLSGYCCELDFERCRYDWDCYDDDDDDDEDDDGNHDNDDDDDDDDD